MDRFVVMTTAMVYFLAMAVVDMIKIVFIVIFNIVYSIFNRRS